MNHTKIRIICTFLSNVHFADVTPNILPVQHG